jgi:hypothetical protein
MVERNINIQNNNGNLTKLKPSDGFFDSQRFRKLAAARRAHSMPEDRGTIYDDDDNDDHLDANSMESTPREILQESGDLTESEGLTTGPTRFSFQKALSLDDDDAAIGSNDEASPTHAATTPRAASDAAGSLMRQFRKKQEDAGTLMIQFRKKQERMRKLRDRDGSPLLGKLRQEDDGPLGTPDPMSPRKVMILRDLESVLSSPTIDLPLGKHDDDSSAVSHEATDSVTTTPFDVKRCRKLNAQLARYHSEGDTDETHLRCKAKRLEKFPALQQHGSPKALAALVELARTRQKSKTTPFVLHRPTIFYPSRDVGGEFSPATRDDNSCLVELGCLMEGVPPSLDAATSEQTGKHKHRNVNKRDLATSGVSPEGVSKKRSQHTCRFFLLMVLLLCGFGVWMTLYTNPSDLSLHVQQFITGVQESMPPYQVTVSEMLVSWAEPPHSSEQRTTRAVLKQSRLKSRRQSSATANTDDPLRESKASSSRLLKEHAAKDSGQMDRRPNKNGVRKHAARIITQLQNHTHGGGAALDLRGFCPSKKPDDFGSANIRNNTMIDRVDKKLFTDLQSGSPRIKVPIVPRIPRSPVVALNHSQFHLESSHGICPASRLETNVSSHIAFDFDWESATMDSVRLASGTDLWLEMGAPLSDPEAIRASIDSQHPRTTSMGRTTTSTANEAGLSLETDETLSTTGYNHNILPNLECCVVTTMHGLNFTSRALEKETTLELSTPLNYKVFFDAELRQRSLPPILQDRPSPEDQDVLEEEDQSNLLGKVLRSARVQVDTLLGKLVATQMEHVQALIKEATMSLHTTSGVTNLYG